MTNHATEREKSGWQSIVVVEFSKLGETSLMQQSHLRGVLSARDLERAPNSAYLPGGSRLRNAPS